METDQEILERLQRHIRRIMSFDDGYGPTDLQTLTRDTIKSISIDFAVLEKEDFGVKDMFDLLVCQVLAHVEITSITILNRNPRANPTSTYAKFWAKQTWHFEIMSSQREHKAAERTNSK